MKYLTLILLFLVSIYFFMVLNFYNNNWHYLQPFLIATLLVYFNLDNYWVYYIFALLAGLFIDSISGVFGLYSFIFITIVFVLKTLQLTWLTAKNILSIIVLTILSFILFGLLFYLINILFNLELYNLGQDIWKIIISFGINIFLTIFFHLLYFNLWVKKHERQSF